MRDMERLYRELEGYHSRDIYPFHMPGHKRNVLSSDGKLPFEMDITEITGFDNLHHAEEIIRQSENELAELYGVRESFFSVNGSTAALLSAVSASVKRGGKILIARNCHKAVYHAIYLRDLDPTYVFPNSDGELGMNGGISPSDVDKSLQEHPEIEAVLITSPTYDGVVSDVKRIAEIVHEHGAVLIVDEAHGAHFHFSEYFPVSAAELGADLVVQSLHKTLPSLTQTAVLHQCTRRVETELLRRFLGIYQSSSPSYLLMAGIDACVDKISRDGRKMFAEFTNNLETARKRLERCRYIQLVTPGMLREKGVEFYDYDRSKMVLGTAGSTLNGRQLHEILHTEFRLEMEMDAEHYVIALSSVGDTREGFDRLCAAIEEIDRRESLKIKKNPGREMQKEALPENVIQKLRPAQAMEMPSVRVSLENSIGKISAEFAYLYPPGIPLIVPGEQITGHLVRNMRRYIRQGLDLQGLSDKKNAGICVVKEQREE